MIKTNSTFRLIWDGVITLLAIINLFIIPLEVAWSGDYTKAADYIVTDYIVDILFLIDIILNFRTTIIDKYGEEVADPK
jgi:hypothetical protein